MLSEPYIGKHLCGLEGDKFTESFIDADTKAEDVQYMETKWWDYRLLHPAQATMYFHHRFYVVASNILMQEVGATEAKQALWNAQWSDLSKKSVLIIRGFWRARMAADAAGMPYDVYIKAAITQFRDNYNLYHTVKASKLPSKVLSPITGKPKKRQVQQLPYSVQMYSLSMIKAAIKHWAYVQEKEFVIPKNPDILNNQFWFRPDMEKWLKAQAVSKGRTEERIQAMKQRGLILNTD